MPKAIRVFWRSPCALPPSAQDDRKYTHQGLFGSRSEPKRRLRSTSTSCPLSAEGDVGALQLPGSPGRAVRRPHGQGLFQVPAEQLLNRSTISYRPGSHDRDRSTERPECPGKSGKFRTTDCRNRAEIKHDATGGSAPKSLKTRRKFYQQ